MEKVKRYTQFTFPDQKFLPGSGARRPENLLPAGASLSLDGNNWKASPAYLFAIDLFNAGYWWEAHEVLESLWKGTKRNTDLAQFLQGLIQICAALLKKSQSIPGGALRLKTRGIHRLPAERGCYLGVELEKLIKEVEAFFTGHRSRPPVIRLKGIRLIR